MRSRNKGLPALASCLLLVLFLLSGKPVFADVAADAVAVPAPLEPWRDWVLDGHRNLACPPHYAELGERFCRWPGRLELRAADTGASFAQDWQLFSPGWVTLPGDGRLWPQAVRVNGRTVAVIERDGSPAVWLEAGEQRLEGELVWEQLPPRLPLPADTGLLSLSLNDKPVAQPAIDEQGQLLFGERSEQKTVADSLSVQVYRRLQDDIPVQLETVLRLSVAGRDREWLAGRLLPASMVPLALDAPLPARIEADGRLRIQLRAGEWEVRLQARAEGQPMVFRAERLDESWPAEEVWSVQDNRALRQLTTGGAASMDPAQTEMPVEWRELPAWLLRAGDTLQWTEQQRGLSAADSVASLSLQRELWLDFDGDGMTSRDVLTGQLPRPLRLQMAPGQALGRAEVNGEPRLITRLAGESGEGGVELRPGSLQLTGVSRLADPASFAVTGWRHDVESASATLHLPPGWLLLHAGGVDQASGAWLPRWNLWAIFLVLIIAAASTRLLGWYAGAVSLLALLLSYHSAHAPVFLWLAVLVSLALLRVLPAGALRQSVSAIAALLLLLLAVAWLQFTVDQLRRSLYPQLERGRWASIQTSEEVVADTAMPASAPAEMAALSEEVKRYEMTVGSAAIQKRKADPLRSGYDSNAKVQTGPGLPAWQWQRVQLHWSGPVLQEQGLRLYLLSPGWQRVWNLGAVLLVTAFAALLARSLWPLRGQSALRPNLALILILLPVLAGQPLPALAESPAAAVAPANWPSVELLQQLEQRLTRLPDCAPLCAGLNRGRLWLDDEQWQLELQLDAATAVAVPLPVARTGWQPRSVLLDGEEATALRRDGDGQLWLALAEGSHRLLLEGEVSGDSAEWSFAMPVHQLAVVAPGWQVSGLVNGQVPGRSLQLSRDSGKGVGSREGAILAEAAPPFVRVTRTLLLGLDWQVHTQVERVAPQSGAINLAVELLPGEAVLTPGLIVRDGKLPVHMSAHAQQFSWHSSLKQTAELVLQAPPGVPWVEHWQLDASPVWHVASSGLNPVGQMAIDGAALPLWRPWPGEQLSLQISRPEAVTGSTRTIESAQLHYRPGARSADAELQLAVLSSQGGELPLTLPAGSQLLRVTLDGKPQSLPQQAALSLPLHPGRQRIEVAWRETSVAGLRVVTPSLDVGEPLSNISVQLDLPQGRWLLAVGGPAMGPALLFWGVLAVMLLVAVLLGRAGFAPVSTVQWLLLGLGMSTVNSAGSLSVVVWFALMAWRARLEPVALSRGRFNVLQIGLLLLTLLAAACLIGTIPMSLLSTPNMQVVGNQSSGLELHWFQDRSAVALPTAWAVSLPLWVYRVVMLAWSLWLVFALLGWCRWGWQAFSAGGYWRGRDENALTLDDAALHDGNKPDGDAT